MKSFFGVFDLVVLLTSLIISISIGIFCAVWDKKKKRTSPDDYFIAGRRSRTFPVALSFVVTFQSSLMFLATPVEVYAYSLMYSYHIVGIMLSYIFAAFVVVPVFYPLKITSVNRYFYLRYGDNLVRYLAVFTSVVYNIFYMGTVIYGTCVAAEVIMGVPYWGTVLIYTSVTTIYTSIGGIKAVIWTDVFQIFSMLLGIIAVLIKTTIDVGGVSRVTELAKDQLYMGDFRVDPTVRYTFWNVSVGTFTTYLYFCLSQSGIQRINSTSSVKAARRIYIISAPIYSIIYFMASYEGVTIFAYHASRGCDILNGGLIDNINQILPVTAIQLFHNSPGVIGMLIAALSCAALSTLSSCLGSLSAITYEDVIRVIYPDMTKTKATQLSKFVVLLYGFIAMAMTFVISKIPGSVMKIIDGIMGCINGPTCAMFLLSLFYRRASSKSVFIGSLFGIIFSFWLIMGQSFSPIPPDPMLASGPTNKCHLYTNASYMSPKDDVLTSTNYNQTTKNISVIQHDQESSQKELSALEKLYTVSYVLISPIGFFVAIVVSMLLSLFLKAPDNINEKCMFSVKNVFGGESRTSNQTEKEENNSDDEINEFTSFQQQ